MAITTRPATARLRTGGLLRDPSMSVRIANNRSATSTAPRVIGGARAGWDGRQGRRNEDSGGLANGERHREVTIAVASRQPIAAHAGRRSGDGDGGGAAVGHEKQTLGVSGRGHGQHDGPCDRPCDHPHVQTSITETGPRGQKAEIAHYPRPIRRNTTPAARHRSGSSVPRPSTRTVTPGRSSGASSVNWR
jgi:hypothetical protein